MEEKYSYIEEMATTTIMIVMIPVSLGCTTISLTLPEVFKLKELEKNLKEIEKTPSKQGQRVVNIKSFRPSKA